MSHNRKHEGVRWRVFYGLYEGVEKSAVDELQAYAQRYLPYVVRVEKAESARQAAEDHAILVGTAENNPLVAEAIENGTFDKPQGPEGYTAACLNSPWAEGKRVIVVAGSDANGVLYGVQDLDRMLRTRIGQPDPPDMRAAFDGLPDFAVSERPAIDNRGIWTWGYVIYDYRRFIDNMARCKMNMLTIWNDCPPINAREVIEYAHSRGVKIVFGFHWGWGIDDLDPNNPEHRARIKEQVVRNYLENYHGLGMDGIYFQTFTEVTKTHVGERSIAGLACEWVNEIARALYEHEPGLSIQFGLHAISVREHYTDLAQLDPRITITWEDAGCIPYAYDPVTDYNYGVFKAPEGTDPVDATIEYSKKLATFRHGTEFAMVPKGFTKLRWNSEFEHHGPFILGERDPEWIRARLAASQPRWDCVNALWAANYPLALRFYRAILDCRPPRFTATALIEDGMFEEKIQLSAAILAETLWNPRRDEGEIMQLALGTASRAG